VHSFVDPHVEAELAGKMIVPGYPYGQQLTTYQFLMTS
jgi:hypothetical protein